MTETGSVWAAAWDVLSVVCVVVVACEVLQWAWDVVRLMMRRD